MKIEISIQNKKKLFNAGNMSWARLTVKKRDWDMKHKRWNVHPGVTVIELKHVWLLPRTALCNKSWVNSTFDVKIDKTKNLFNLYWSITYQDEEPDDVSGLRIRNYWTAWIREHSAGIRRRLSPFTYRNFSPDHLQIALASGLKQSGRCGG
jgi:hypothetical protein